jgi:hypothetical protein
LILSGDIGRHAEVQRQKREQHRTPGRPAQRETAPSFDTQPPGHRAGPDLRKTPKGYDPEVWQLALLFTDKADDYDVELVTGPVLVYGKMFRRISKTKLRSRKNWVSVVEKMIAEFWDNQVTIATEAYAIDEFCGVETFKGLAQWALREQINAATEWRIENMSGIRERGGRRRAERAERATIRAARVDYEDEESVQRFRDRVRAKIDEAIKEFAE